MSKTTKYSILKINYLSRATGITALRFWMTMNVAWFADAETVKSQK